MCNELVFRTAYAYGSFETGRFGFIVLRRDGCVGHYEHPNERYFILKNGRLNFVDADGNIQNDVFSYERRLNSFFSTNRYLIPIISLTCVPRRVAGVSVFVNTIPKAGTYLIDALLTKLSFASIGLHLSDWYVDDNRGLPPEEFHRAPYLRRVQCPVTAAVSLMEPGEMGVGHIASVPHLHTIGKRCVLIQLVRNLRNVLVSMYRFKQKRVEALDASDLFWRTLPEPQRFHGFLIHSHTRDSLLIAAVADGILESGVGLRLKHEDILEPATADAACAKLAAALGLATSAVFSKLGEAVALPTSTSNKSPTNAAMIGGLWNDDVEAYFRSTELFQLNARLGYEPGL